MSELLAEVDEAIKREKLEYVWKTYGNIFLTAILLIIVGTGGYSAYSGWKNERHKKQTDILIGAEALADPTKLVDVSKNLGSGLEGIAKMKAAGAFLAQNDETQALALYEDVSHDKSYAKEFRDLASYMKGRLIAKSNPSAAITLLEALSADKDNAYRFHAHLEAALVYAHANQDYARARKHLEAVMAEKDLPPSLNAKANALHVLYALKEKK